MMKRARIICWMLGALFFVTGCSSSQGPDDETVKEQWKACFLNAVPIHEKIGDYAQITDIKVIDRKIEEKQATIIIEATVELTKGFGWQHSFPGGSDDMKEGDKRTNKYTAIFDRFEKGWRLRRCV